MMERVLVIASDCCLTNRLCEALRREGYLVHRTVSPSAPVHVDFILLALDSEADELVTQCRRIPGLERAPMLAWLRRAGSVAAVLRHGADDCVTGEADLAEVMARTGALLRRARPGHASGVLLFGGVRVDVRKSTLLGNSAADRAMARALSLQFTAL